jgi:hypothetical protein
VTLYECGASLNTQQALLNPFAHAELARAAIPAIRDHFRDIRKSTSDAVRHWSNSVVHGKLDEELAAARKQGSQEATRALSDEHAATVKAKDSKIEALEAEIMALRGKLTPPVDEPTTDKPKRTRRTPRRAMRKAVRK